MDSREQSLIVAAHLLSIVWFFLRTVDVALFESNGIIFVSVRDDCGSREDDLCDEMLDLLLFMALHVFNANLANGFATFFSNNYDFLVLCTTQKASCTSATALNA